MRLSRMPSSRTGYSRRQDAAEQIKCSREAVVGCGAVADYQTALIGVLRFAAEAAQAGEGKPDISCTGEGVSLDGEIAGKGQEGMESRRYAGDPDVRCMFVEHRCQLIASVAISEPCLANVTIVSASPYEFR